MKNKKEKLARFGIAAKGAVYALIGLLTAMAAFNLGGTMSGNKNALQFLASQPFGMVLLAILGTGLFGYSFYRVVEAFKGDGKSWKTVKGFVKRAGFVVSAIFYGALGFTALKMVAGGSSGSDGDSLMQTIMGKPYGPYLLVFIALCLAGKSGYQFYKAFSGKYRHDVEEARLSPRVQKILLRAGAMGFTARGIVSGIVAFLLFRVALTQQGTASGKVAAFEFLQNSLGASIMGLVALGLVAYAVFMFIQARYAKVKF
ncbi:MAG: hypothetical protein CL868_12890 [Cytophagaceae bacterium]|nr:hypothetical protein [Cytophagaceae bacterium]|tara:strand:+ start:655 stop:1428 length:774 start_codon:yes stop_codon:yes gene_type:complete